MLRYYGRHRWGWRLAGMGRVELIRALLSVRWIAALALAVLAVLAVVAASGGATAQDGGASSVDGRIVVRPWVDDAGQLSRVEVGFRPGWGLDVRGGADGPDDISPPLRFLTRRLIDERAGTWLRSSEMLIPDAEGSETGVRGRILVRAEADEEGQLTRIEFGFRPDWGADIRGTESGPDDIFPPNRFLTRRLIDGSAEKWLRSSLITVPGARPVETTEPSEGEVGAAGGVASAEDGATITVPADAAAMGAEITARVATEEELPPLPDGATEVLGAWDFEVEGGLTGAVTLTLPVSSDEDETWFLAHYDGERWFLESFTAVDGAIIVQTDSLSFWKRIKGIPIVGTIAKGVEAGGKYFVEGVKKIAEVTWDAVTWTVDWGLEELGLKEPIVCDQPDGSVQVTNPTGGGLVGIYLKGCAQQTADGPLLAARNPRHIWFEVRPIEGEPEYATSLDIYKFLSSHDEGTLLAPSAVGDWRPTRDGTVRLNAEMTWTAAGLTVFYQPIKEMVEAAVGFALPSSALTSLVQKLLSASELRVAVQEFQRGNREAALKTAAVVILSEPMRDLVIDVVISYARSRGVTLAKAPLIKAYVVYKVGEFLVKRAQAGVEFFKVLVANDEDRLGTVAYRVPRSVCWGSAFGAAGGNVGDRLGHACQSLQRPERYARYYRFELERPATVTIDLTSASLDGYLYLLSGEGRSGRVVASDDDGGDWLNARIEQELEPGVYTIQVTTGGSERRKKGQYRLVVRRMSSAEADGSDAETDGAGDGVSDTTGADGSAVSGGGGAVFTAVSAGGEHSCGLRETGAVECWGRNEHGQAAAPSGRFSAVSAGESHSCGLRETGAVECWGHNGRGQTDAPSGRFSAVSAGRDHSCGLRETGVVECWGANEYGETAAPSGRFSAVSTGGWHSCGLRETGVVECWGWNKGGQTAALGGRFSAVSAGVWHSCGLRETGAVECWGGSGHRSGQTRAPGGRFSAVSAGLWDNCGLRETGAVECWGASGGDAPSGRFSAVSAGHGHSCGLRETGAVECWGTNSHGQTAAPSGRYSAVSAGQYHSCGLQETGAVECWGFNSAGQTAAPSGRFVAVSAGDWNHSCGLRETGAVECWGDNEYGETAAPSGRFSAVSTGAYHSCGLRETGAVECWGYNEGGETAAPSGRFSAVSTGAYHSCGLQETGAVECWGFNSAGQTAAPSGRFIAVSAGFVHSCGLRETGAVECWGANEYGRTNAPSGRFIAVSAGWYHSCGLRETGAVECWGNNEYGETDAPSGRFIAVSAGNRHSCGLQETGAVECWGELAVRIVP